MVESAITNYSYSSIGGIIARRLKSHEVIYNTLVPIAEQRCIERDLKAAGHTVPTHVS
jgi:hypothetical protein